MKGGVKLTSLNERIKELRKDCSLSQKEFATKIGISQRSVSWSEQSGNNVPDSTIKSLCMAFNVNENWLRTGEPPMYVEEQTFSLDEFVKKRGGSELELEILKAYFELEPDIRQEIIKEFIRSQIGASRDKFSKITVQEAEAEYIKSRSKPAKKTEQYVLSSTEDTTDSENNADKAANQ